MKRILLATTFITLLTSSSFSQSVSVADTFYWSDPAAWVGAVPGPSDDVIISSGSVITNATSTLVRNNITHIDSGGVLIGFAAQFNDTELEIDSAGVFEFFSTIQFSSSRLTNSGLYTTPETTFYCPSCDSSAISNNHGQMLIDGNLNVLGTHVFNNTNDLNAEFNTLIVSTGVEFNNTGSALFESVENGGTVIADTGVFEVYGDFMNNGDVVVYDALFIDGAYISDTSADISNMGLVDVAGDFYNEGAVQGSGGQYDIGAESYNGTIGTISGDIDVCDASLLPGTYFDFDLNWGGIDFNTVTFCTNSHVNIEENFVSNIQVYPNPVKDILYFSGIENGIGSLISGNGRKVMDIDFSETTSISISHLPNGIYYLNLGASREVKKIVKL